MPTGKQSEAALAKRLIAGTNKHLSTLSTLMFGDGSYTPAQVTGQLQNLATLRDDVTAAQATAKAKLAAEKAQAPTLVVFTRTMRRRMHRNESGAEGCRALFARAKCSGVSRLGSMLALCGAVSCSVVGCEPTIHMTTTGPTQPSRGDRCDFQMLTAVPSTGFVEIGTIDIERKPYDPITSPDRLVDRIEKYVCRAGGDAAVAVKNDAGHYVQAKVLKSTGPVPSDVAAAPSTATTADGCHYDTQCKGDRVCVDGGCVDPVKK